MKTKFSFLALVLVSTLSLYAQQKVPANVIAVFNSKFPNAQNVKWGKESKTEYEADFKINTQTMSANFSDQGAWLETESTITFDQIPEKVKQAFSTLHPGSSVKVVEKVESPEGTKFELKIKEKNKSKEILYSEEGVEIKN